jgi:hypothetical protein
MRAQLRLIADKLILATQLQGSMTKLPDRKLRTALKIFSDEPDKQSFFLRIVGTGPEFLLFY